MLMTEEDKQILQRVVDSLFNDMKRTSRLDVILRAECFDLPADLIGIVELLPPGHFTRQALCDQLNSALKGHGWTGRFGTVD